MALFLIFIGSLFGPMIRARTKQHPNSFFGMTQLLTKRRHVLGGACAAAAIFAWGHSHAAPSPGRFTLRGTVFEQAAARSGVDPYLLYSVALLESGFGHGKGSVGPWFWTLRAPTNAFYLDARVEAEAKLRDLLRHSSLVDVGAMQINVRWNGHRVATPSQLLDPTTNIQVGADILAEALASSPRDLALGVGRYHNWSDLARAQNYGLRALAVRSNLQALSEGRRP
ncbi:transglycosylase SLT domain-containing protein [Streptomyces sp. G35A]